MKKCLTIQKMCVYLSYQNNKMENININTATKSEMESAFIFDENLEKYLGGFDKASQMTENELREKITNYIIEGNEATCE